MNLEQEQGTKSARGAKSPPNEQPPKILKTNRYLYLHSMWQSACATPNYLPIPPHPLSHEYEGVIILRRS